MTITNVYVDHLSNETHATGLLQADEKQFLRYQCMETNRLTLSELEIADTDFIFELLNTPQWIKYIGDRNIKTKEDARAYIQKITGNPAFNYWVAKLKNESIPVGVVTFMKRDYLDDYDIGYAFLPQFAGQGYAFEASKKVMDTISPQHEKIVATVLKENTTSIQLLLKLGLQFDKEIIVNNENLLLYSIVIQK